MSVLRIYSRNLIILICLAVNPSESHAEISVLDSKGIHAAIKPEYQNYSLLAGLNLLKSGTLESYFRTGNPEDKTIKFLHLLFQSPDGLSFSITQSIGNVSRTFTPQTIGLILGFLSMLEDSEVTHRTHRAALSEQLADLIWTELALEPSDLRRPRLLERISHYNDLIAQYSIESAGQGKGAQSNSRRLVHLRATLKALEEALNNPIQSSPIQASNVATPKRENVEQFVGGLMGAKRESLGHQKKYPSHFVEQVLVAFAWKKFNLKEDLLDLLSKAPHLVADLKLLEKNHPHRETWLRTRYTDSDHQAYEALLLKEGVTALLQNPEPLAFLTAARKAQANSLPPLISEARIVLESVGFSDCVESSVRNFFNIVLKDGEHFNSGRLIKAAQMYPSLQPKRELIEFYTSNSEFSEINQSRVREEWSQKVLSELKSPSVVYMQPSSNPKFEIKPGMRNFLAVFENLLFSNDSEFHELTSSQKLDRICEVLSREGFLLSWKLQKESNDQLNKKEWGISIDFFVNGSSSFYWKIKFGHTVLARAVEESDPWRDEDRVRVADILSKKSEFTFQELQLANWFSTGVRNVSHPLSHPHSFIEAFPEQSESSLVRTSEILLPVTVQDDPNATFVVVETETRRPSWKRSFTEFLRKTFTRLK
jgi:hypothetical protein